MKKYQGAFIKNEREIACLREANRMVANILDAIGDIVKPGETTMRFEELARDMCADYNVKPAFLGYYGDPYATCCSVNEQVVHGFPPRGCLRKGTSSASTWAWSLKVLWATLRALSLWAR